MNLRLLFGDQLSTQLSSLSDLNSQEDWICLFEVREEATVVKHHKKKLAFLFAAMRHFAAELRAQGYQVHYSRLDDPENTGSFFGELQRKVEQLQPDKIILTEPSEYRVEQEVGTWAKRLGVEVEQREDNRFLATRSTFKSWAENRKQLRMEFYYREMRREYGILMDEYQPIGGQWNYDSENRKRPPADHNKPETYAATPDAVTQEVIELVEREFGDHFGDLQPFHYAVNRAQAMQALEQFIDKRLSNFGDYQDAMLSSDPWMYHSHIGLYLNCGLLLPLECIEKVEQAYHSGAVPLNAAEGFIRQILGWREFVRGIYWLYMPEYSQCNALEAKRSLPALYWDAPTKMNCMHQCVRNTKQNAYAHHIQRLMVLGNFALLAGLDPEEVNEWYLIVYADAYEWVERPNVSGMVLFADGGKLASKPYAASGAYINKMSDYCKGCRYAVSKKNGLDACPFNYLYWDFLMRNRDHLGRNPRLGMPYRTLDKMTAEKTSAVQNDASRFLAAMDAGHPV